MPTSPYRMNPSLGPNLWQVVRANQVWYEGAGRGAAGAGQIGSPQPGETAFGDDGFEYMWVQATGAIAAAAAPGTQVSLTLNSTDPRATAATGAGGWYAPTNAVMSTALAAGDRFWARKGTAP